MRTQQDRDEDLQIGRDLERKDAEIDALRAENARLRNALELIAGSASDQLQVIQAKNALDSI